MAKMSVFTLLVLLFAAYGCSLNQMSRQEAAEEQQRLERLRQECLHCNPGGPCDTATLKALGLRGACPGGMGP